MNAHTYYSPSHSGSDGVIKQQSIKLCITNRSRVRVRVRVRVLGTTNTGTGTLPDIRLAFLLLLLFCISHFRRCQNTIKILAEKR